LKFIAATSLIAFAVNEPVSRVPVPILCRYSCFATIGGPVGRTLPAVPCPWRQSMLHEAQLLTALEAELLDSSLEDFDILKRESFSRHCHPPLYPCQSLLA